MMLENIFIWILNMSLTGSLMIFAVLLMRLFLRKAPKVFSYTLWLVVLFRLLCPVSFESEFSLLGILGVNTEERGTVEYISGSYGSDMPMGNLHMITDPAMVDENHGFSREETGNRDSAQNGRVTGETVRQETMEPGAPGQEEARPDTDHTEALGLLQLLYSLQLQSVFSVGSVIWIIGVSGLLLYGFGSYMHLNRKLFRLESNELEFKELKLKEPESKEQGSKDMELNGTAEDNVSAGKNRTRVYRCNDIPTAFVLGFFRPRIYLPANLDETEERYILLHEQVHIKRGDSLYRTIAYLALCLHWFNPFVWLAFHLSGMDMEMSCDEAVIRQIGSGIKKEYSKTLLALATGSSMVKGIPLAFGEGDTGSRIKNVLGYKKPTVIIVAVILVLCLGAAVFLLGNPIKNEQENQMLNQIADPAEEEPNEDREIVCENPYFFSRDVSRLSAYISYGNPLNFEIVVGELELHWLKQYENGCLAKLSVLPFYNMPDYLDEEVLNIYLYVTQDEIYHVNSYIYQNGNFLTFHNNDSLLMEYFDTDEKLIDNGELVFCLEDRQGYEGNTYIDFMPYDDELMYVREELVEDRGLEFVKYLIWKDGVGLIEYGAGSGEEILYLANIGILPEINLYEGDVKEFLETVTDDMLSAYDEVPPYEAFMNDPIVFLNKFNDDIYLYGIRTAEQERILMYVQGERVIIDTAWGNNYAEPPKLNCADIDSDGLEEVIISNVTIAGNVMQYELIVCDCEDTWNVYTYDDYVQDIEDTIVWQYDDAENTILIMDKGGNVLRELELPEWTEDYPFTGKVVYDEWMTFDAETMLLSTTPLFGLEHSLPFDPIDIVFEVIYKDGEFELGDYYIRDSIQR